jgi:hypothetical protein
VEVEQEVVKWPQNMMAVALSNRGMERYPRLPADMVRVLLDQQVGRVQQMGKV